MASHSCLAGPGFRCWALSRFRYARAKLAKVNAKFLGKNSKLLPGSFQFARLLVCRLFILLSLPPTASLLPPNNFRFAAWDSSGKKRYLPQKIRFGCTSSHTSPAHRNISSFTKQLF